MKKLALPFALFLAGAGVILVGCGGYAENEPTAVCNDGRNSYETDCSKICVGRGGVARWFINCEGSSIGLGSGR